MRTFDPSRPRRVAGLLVLAALAVTGRAATGQPAADFPSVPPAEVPPAMMFGSTGPAGGTIGSPGGPADASGGTPAGSNAAAGGNTPSNTVPTGAAANAPKFEAVWNNGLFFQTKDKDFLFHVGGTVHYDGAWYTAPAALERFPGGTGPFNDGVNLRRGRIRMEGTAYKDYDFLFELEFANGFLPAGTGTAGGNVGGVTSVTNSPGPTDAWVTVKNVPFLGNVRIGSQKEPFSLEHLAGYRFLEFMERSYLFDMSQPTAFNNGFSPGISAFRTWADDRVTTAVGVFKNDSDLIGVGVGDGEYAVTGRVTYLPVYDPDQKRILHVGGAMSYRDPVNDQVRVRIRNEVRNAPFPLLNLVADTGTLNADSQTLFNLETAAVLGPVTLQAEYTANLIDRTAVPGGVDPGTAVVQGFYAHGLMFLTGESRTWNPKTATFNRVIPKQNFGFGSGGGMGAWEVGARYTYLDLNDDGVRGGRLNNATVGLNWYWNPNMRMQFNYDYAYRDAGVNPLARGSIHSFGTRLALDF